MDFVKPKSKTYHFTVDPRLTITLKRPMVSSAEHFEVSLGHQPNCTRSPQEKMRSPGLDGPSGEVAWSGDLVTTRVPGGKKGVAFIVLRPFRIPRAGPLCDGVPPGERLGRP